MSAGETRDTLTQEAETIAEPAGSQLKPKDSVVNVESSSKAAAGGTATEESAVSKQAEDPVGQNNEDIQILSQRVEQLAGLLKEANLISSDRERIVDRLHEENQELRSGELWQAVAPVFRDLVRLYDDLELTTRRYETKTEIDVTEVERDFQSFRDAVEDVLYRHGVERYGTTEGTPFNSKEHKALGVVATADAGLDRAIARVVRSGFRTESRVLRILEAEVFRFSPAPPPVEKEEPKDEEPGVIA